MSVIPCERNEALQNLIREYAEVLRTKAHTLGAHGLSEDEFYNSGLFRGAIERIRGQFAATMRDKRDFVRHILNYMQDRHFIQSWDSAGEANRFDYTIILPDGRVSVVEIKGCLDGNNTNIFERPPQAQEFIIWSLCTNAAADPRHNTWSGIHTRLSAEIISRQQRVDGVVVWDMVCNTVGRPCPKVAGELERVTEVAHYRVPPPCIYMLPATIAAARNNPHPTAQPLDAVHFLRALHECFRGRDEEVNYVDFDVKNQGADIVRRTRIRRAGAVVRESKFIAIQRA